MANHKSDDFPAPMINITLPEGGADWLNPRASGLRVGWAYRCQRYSVYTCSASIWEVEAGELGVQGYIGEFEASLCYMTPYFKN